MKEIYSRELTRHQINYLIAIMENEKGMSHAIYKGKEVIVFNSTSPDNFDDWHILSAEIPDNNYMLTRDDFEIIRE